MNHRKRNRHLSEAPAYTGSFGTKTRIEALTYSAQDFKEKTVAHPAEIPALLDSESVNWIRVHGMTDAAAIIALVKQFGLSELDARDILTTDHVMSIEEYDDNLFVVMPVVYQYEEKTVSEQVALILGHNYLISIQESDFPLFKAVYAEIRDERTSKFNQRKAGFLMATLMNELVSGYSEEALRLEDRLEELEDRLLDIRNLRDDPVMTDIQLQRREMIRLHKQLTPFKDQLTKLLHADSPLIDKSERPYFKDVYDQLLFVLQNLMSCREIMSSLVDLYLNNNDVKMNLVMKQLTVVATIFIPLTFLVGVWGMNFDHMPELHFRHGYLMAWVLMIAIGIAVWWYLRRNDRT
jgi:magnesium transporter